MGLVRLKAPVSHPLDTRRLPLPHPSTHTYLVLGLSNRRLKRRLLLLCVVLRALVDRPLIGPHLRLVQFEKDVLVARGKIAQAQNKVKAARVEAARRGGRSSGSEHIGFRLAPLGGGGGAGGSVGAGGGFRLRKVGGEQLHQPVAYRGAMGSHFDRGPLPGALNWRVAEQLLEVLHEIGRLLCAELRVSRAVCPTDRAVATLDA